MIPTTDSTDNFIIKFLQLFVYLQISISVYLRKHGDPIAKAKEAVWP